jgi:hypothetical protein
MKTRTVDLTRSPQEELRSRIHVHLDQDGGNPSHLLEMLDLMIQDEIWLKFEKKLSFRQFVELPYEQGGLGWTMDSLKCILQMQHRFEHEGSSHTEIQERLQEMRRRVMDLLHDPSNGHGGDRKSTLHSNLDFAPSEQRGNSSSHKLRRLKRDRPDLAERVMAHELSATAAAIEAGFEPYKFQVRADDPRKTARIIAKHVDREWMAALIDELRKAMEE